MENIPTPAEQGSSTENSLDPFLSQFVLDASFGYLPDNPIYLKLHFLLPNLGDSEIRGIIEQIRDGQLRINISDLLLATQAILVNGQLQLIV